VSVGDAKYVGIGICIINVEEIVLILSPGTLDRKVAGLDFKSSLENSLVHF